ncbi:MAG: putative transcriptional regulator [Haloarculaceae archaeon]|jgi:predicted transcriptional regulator
MGSSRGAVQFVMGSSVRTDILRVLADRDRSTDDVIDSLDASTSAVYNGLSELEDNGLITSENGTYSLTGRGRLLADIVTESTRHERVLSDMAGYLESHDTEVLPRPLRLRIGDLAGGSVLEATETEPHRVVTEVTERIDAADSVKVISPIHIDSYEGAMPDVEGARLVVDEKVANWASQSRGDVADIFDNVRVRIADVDFALGVTGSELLLSLPLLDGSYDSEAEIIAEHDRAREWGDRLFEFVWDDGVPPDRFDPPDDT